MSATLNINTVLTGENIVLRPYRLSDAGVVLEAINESLPELLPWMPWAHQDYRLKEVRDYKQVYRKLEGWFFPRIRNHRCF